MAQISNLDELFPPTPEAPETPPIGQRGLFGKATERGVANLIQGIGGLTELVGAEDTGRAIQEFARPLAERAGPSQYGAADIFTNPLGLAGEAIAENLPLMAGVGAGSLIGRGAVAIGARQAAKEGLKLTAKQAANRALVGDVLSEGIIASSTLGDVYASQPEENKNRARALVTGLPSYWLERMGGEALARGVIGGEIKRGGKWNITTDASTGVRTREWIPESRTKFAARKAAETALIEGPLTEAPQTVLEALGTGQDLTAKNLLDAVVKGSIAGGAFGGGFGFFTPGERKSMQDRIRRGVDTLKLDLETGDAAGGGVDIETGYPHAVRNLMDIGEPLRLAGPPPRTDYVPNFIPGEQVEGPPRYGQPNWTLPASRQLPPPGMSIADIGVQEIPFEEAVAQVNPEDQGGPPPGTRGYRVQTLPLPEIVADFAGERGLGRVGVETLPVEEITLDQRSSPEAMAAARTAALAAAAPAGPTAMELAFTNALAARMQAQRASEIDAAFAARQQAEAQTRAAEEEQIAQAGQRAQLEQAATVIEQGGKPPPRFMRPDVDTVVAGVTADIAATGGKAAMPRGLKARIYSAMKLGTGRGNYGTQVAGLTKLLNSLDPNTKSYEIVGRLLDTLRGVQSETQQTPAAPANGGGTSGAAAVSRPRKRAAKVPAARKQAGKGNVPASTGPSETSAKAEVKGETNGPERKATDVGSAAPGQSSAAAASAASPGGPASAVRPGSNQAANNAAERASGSRAASESGPAAVNAPAERTEGRNDTTAKGGVVQRNTRGVSGGPASGTGSTGSTGSTRGTAAKRAAPSSTSAPAAVVAPEDRGTDQGRAGRTAESAEAVDVTSLGPKTRVKTKSGKEGTIIGVLGERYTLDDNSVVNASEVVEVNGKAVAPTEEKANAVQKQSPSKGAARESTGSRSKVGQEVRGAEKPASEVGGTKAAPAEKVAPKIKPKRVTRKQSLQNLHDMVAEVASETGIPESQILAIYGAFTDNLTRESEKSGNRETLKGYVWDQPRDMEDVRNVLPFVSDLTDQKEVHRFLDAERSWWYDLNWAVQTIRTKGKFTAVIPKGQPYEGTNLGLRPVKHPRTGKMTPLWEVMTDILRATPKQIAQASEKVAEYERRDAAIFAKRSAARERVRKENQTYLEQIEREEATAQRDMADVLRAKRAAEAVGNRAQRRAGLQPKKQGALIDDKTSLEALFTRDNSKVGPVVQRMITKASHIGVRLEDLLDAVAQNTDNRFMRFLAAHLSSIPGLADMRVYSTEILTDKDVPGGDPNYWKTHPKEAKMAGWFDASPKTGGIFLKPFTDGGANAITVIHEAIHAATWWRIEAAMERINRMTPEQLRRVRKAVPWVDAVVSLHGVHQLAIQAAKTRGLSEEFKHQLSDLHEFIAAGFTESEFQKFLKSEVLPESVQRKLQRFVRAPIKTAWNWFTNSLRSLLDIPSNNEIRTMFDAVMDIGPATIGASPRDQTRGIADHYRRRGITKTKVSPSMATPAEVFPNISESVGKLFKTFTDRGWVSGLKAKALQTALGWMTLGNIQDTFQNQFPQLRQYFQTKAKQQRLVTELNNETGEFLSKAERLIAKHGGWDVTKGDNHPISILYRVMGESTLAEYFPDNGNIYSQPRLANKTRAEADKYLATPEGKQWLDQVNAIKSDWQSLNAKDPALGRLFTDAYKLNKQRYDQSLKLFKQALLDNMYDGVFPSNIDPNDADAKEKWLRQENDRVRPGGFSPDPHKYNVLQTVLKPLNELQKRVAEVRGPYFHLGRFGEYAVRWVDKDGVVNMKRFGDRNEFLEAVNALVAEGADKRKLKRDGEEKQVWYAERMEDRTINEFDRGSDKFVQSMLQRVEVKYGETDPEQAKFLKQAIRSMYLQMLPDTAFYKVFQKRKGTPGYNPDMLRSYAHRAEIMNRTIGYGTHARDIQKSLGELRANVKSLGERVGSTAAFEKAERGRMIVDELRRREVNGVSQPNTPWIDTATSLNYMFYLALSPAYIVTNLTQPWMLTMPFLGGRHGWVASAKALGGSTKTAWAIVRNLIDTSVKGSKEADWITQATVAGRPSLQFKDMAFLTEGQKSAMEYIAAHGQLDLTLTHEVGEVAKLGATSKWGRAKTIGGLASHYSEIVNRVAAGLAAYDLEFARTKDQAKAEERALKIVRRTQFDYSHANLARQMSKQGVFSKYTPLVMAFQRFNAQLLEAYVDTTMRAFGKLTEGMSQAEAKQQIAEARKTLAGMLGTSAMFAGLMGMPAANLIFAVLDKLFGSDDEPVDTKALTRQWFADIFGNELGEALTMGPSRLAGVNLTRVGQQDIVPLTRLLSDKRELKDMFEAQAVDMLGPVVGGSFDILQGAHKILEGRPVEGLKTALPLALRGPVKAFEMGTGYTTDSKGNPIPINFNSWDVLNQAFGFSPPKLAERQAALYTINTHNRQIQMAASKIRNRYYQAVKEGDGAKIQRAVEDVRAWNMKHGADSPILGADLAQGIARRERQFQTGMTLGPGVGVASYKDLPKLDIAKWANVGR